MTKIFNLISARKDVFLAFLLICIVFMMIIPLPTWIVDTLIAVNLCLAAILLMVAIYINEVVLFSAFPSILLLTTLFRLSLSITTTRLILLDADAGKIVETFGSFVVSGNLVVGGVIFLILTIVNFLVITKGSERVAEVAARFSLDAMPGKQMSIDSDMRAGQIELEEAQGRRSKLEKESQLYGAMDGAMKFVKGDAIAGLIIIAVNIIGGIIIGMSQRGMSGGEALNVYAILTIGDGLVSQIPALFISITAGFIVTRVSSVENLDLGSDITNQLIGEPKALLISGIILLCFSIIPGFPTIIFMILASVCLLVGFMQMKGTKFSLIPEKADNMESFLPAIKTSNLPAPSFPGKSDEDEDEEKVEPVTFALTVPLIVDISSSVREKIKPSKLNKEVAKVRKALYFDLGVPFPGINLRLNDNLEEGHYLIMINEIPIASGRAKPDHFIVRDSEENLAMFDIPFEKDQDFLPNIPTRWVHIHHYHHVEKSGIQMMTLSSMMTYHLAHVLKNHADEFIGIQEAMYLIKQMETSYEDLVKEVARALPIISIASIFKRLVSEGISIRDTRTILEALVEWGQKEKDPILLTEHVRISLSRYITHKFSGGQNVIPAYLLSKDIENEVRNSIRQTSGVSYLALSPAVHQKIIQSAKNTIQAPGHQAILPVIITAMDIRRFVRKIIEREFPDIAVLSYQELTSTVNVQTIDKVEI